MSGITGAPITMGPGPGPTFTALDPAGVLAWEFGSGAFPASSTSFVPGFVPQDVVITTDDDDGPSTTTIVAVAAAVLVAGAALFYTMR